MNLRRLLIVLGLLGLALLLLSLFGSLHSVLAAFRTFHWYLLPLLVLIQLLSYYCNAKYYQAFFRISGHPIELRRLYEAALAINFANQAIPSGGVAATTYLTQAAQPYGVPAGKATLAQLGRYIFTFLSYFLVLAFGFITLFFSNDLNKLSVRLVIVIMIAILVAGSVLLAIFSERRRLEATINPVVRGINAIGRLFRSRRQPLLGPDRLDHFLTELYRGYNEIMSHKRRWPILLGWALGGNIAETLTIFTVFIGFGHLVNPGIVITGYTLAIATSAGGAGNGLGFYEAGMIGAFAALGVPFALSFDAVITYRLLSFAIFLPPGVYYYRRHLKKEET